LPPIHQIDIHVGRRLRERRQELGMSQGSLGRHLGITFGQIQKYEKGSNRIGAGRLYRVAAVLGVPVQYFFEGLGEPDPAARIESAASDAGQMLDLIDRISNPDARQALIALVSSMARD
jgi:transcriptional regulator with XRE-family HTH domain